MQAAAEKAVKQYDEASVVAVRPSTGAIRAVANNPVTEFNVALEGQQAPGSTMKIVTAAMLLERGKATANGAVECPVDVMYQGRTFHNLNNSSLPDGSSFTQTFANSCNTGFIKLIDDVDDDSALAKEAKEVFGIGEDWKTGVTSFDGSVPEETGGEAAPSTSGRARSR